MRPRLTVVALVVLALAGCASEPGTSARQDGFLGALASGFADTTFSTPPATRVNAPPGSVVNSILSGPVGASLGERDRQRAYAAEMQALETGEPGEPTAWRGETGGRYGTIVPGAYYQARGARCRDYTHTIYIDGRPQAGRSTACRNPDGTWSPVG